MGGIPQFCEYRLMRRACLGKCEVVMWSAGDVEDRGGACFEGVVN